MTRAVPEWIGATPDTPIPPRVKDRVFIAHGGRCYLSGRKIFPGDPWDAEHVIAIINGGENRESNLKPALRDKHREKTAADVAIKSKTYRMRAKNNGSWPKPKSRLQSGGFGGGPSKKQQREAQRRQEVTCFADRGDGYEGRQAVVSPTSLRLAARQEGEDAA